jgi:hypothetical protein
MSEATYVLPVRELSRLNLGHLPAKRGYRRSENLRESCRANGRFRGLSRPNLEIKRHGFVA